LTVPPLFAVTVEDSRRVLALARARGVVIGLVPTMGALHAGHVSLIRAARADCGFVAVSIFVNPTQFGPNEDLSRYPRPFQQDMQVCAAEGVDLVFHPEPATLYPPGYHTFVDVHELQDALCGASRPGHFRGVATVVLKLFNIIQPDIAYFGQKDAQQFRVLEQMVHDLDVPVKLKPCPIVREADGLALSSRNQYLGPEQRLQATVLYQALEDVREQVGKGERSARILVQTMTERVAATPGAALDYAAVVDFASLQPIDRLHGQVLAALAVRFGGTRLIDNILMNID
jgi:pantoate--beta-alanine ligase